MAIKRSHSRKAAGVRELTDHEMLIQQQQRKLEEQEALIQAQIQQIEEDKRLKKEAEERQRLQAEEDEITLPPLSEIQDRERERKFMGKLSRRQMANEKRSQASNGLLLLLLILAIVALGFWIYSVVQG